MENLADAVLQLHLQEPDSSQPSSPESYSPTSSSTDLSDNTPSENDSKVHRRIKFNESLHCCNTPTIGPSKKRWVETSVRTKKGHIGKAKNLVVARLEVIAPRGTGHLWEALRNSGTVEKEFGIGEESPEEQKYHNALAETYRHVSCWETGRQVLSIMADLISFKRIQHYIPGLTEYRFKMARHHVLQYGGGAEVSMLKSPRLRIELTQFDHFLDCITSPHVIQDLPFGQRHLRLSSGQVLEIPSRLVQQYQVYCKETEFKPFGAATMLCILSACSATVRKSLQGLDYTAAAGAKGFDDLNTLIEQLEEMGLSKKLQNAGRDH